jgi:hypothetical protein
MREQIEVNGIAPVISILWSFDEATAGIDRQLNGEAEALRAA